MNCHARPRLLTCLLVAGVFSLAAYAAPAQPAAALSPDTAVQIERDTAASEATLDQSTQAPQRARAERHCLRFTGSRIIPRDKSGRQCVAAAGSVYTREDLETTGAVDVADALRRLDPRIR